MEDVDGFQVDSGRLWFIKFGGQSLLEYESET